MRLFFMSVQDTSHFSEIGVQLCHYVCLGQPSGYLERRQRDILLLQQRIASLQFMRRKATLSNLRINQVLHHWG